MFFMFSSLGFDSDKIAQTELNVTVSCCVLASI